MNEWLLSLFLTGAMSVGLSAQTPNGVVRFPSGDADWTVDMTYPNQPVAAAPAPAPVLNGHPVPVGGPILQPMKVEITRVKPVERFRIVWSDKSTTETWIINNHTLIESPYGHYIEVERGLRIPDDLGHLDEKLFAWIGAKTPASMATFAGNPCFLYRMSPGSTTKEPEDAETPQTRQAWINETTFIPVAYKDALRQEQFTFMAVPTQPLSLPPKFQSAMDEYDNSGTKLLPQFAPKDPQ